MQRSTVLRSRYRSASKDTGRPPAAALLAVRGLIGLLWDDGLDPATAQVGAVGPGGVRLIGSDGIRASARASDRAAYLDLLQHRDEPGAVGGLPGRERKQPMNIAGNDHSGRLDRYRGTPGSDHREGFGSQVRNVPDLAVKRNSAEP